MANVEEIPNSSGNTPAGRGEQAPLHCTTLAQASPLVPLQIEAVTQHTDHCCQQALVRQPGQDLGGALDSHCRPWRTWPVSVRGSADLLQAVLNHPVHKLTPALPSRPGEPQLLLHLALCQSSSGLCVCIPTFLQTASQELQLPNPTGRFPSAVFASDSHHKPCTGSHSCTHCS